MSLLSRHGPRLKTRLSVCRLKHASELRPLLRTWNTSQLLHRDLMTTVWALVFNVFNPFLKKKNTKSFRSQYCFSWQMSCRWVAPHLIFPQCRFTGSFFYFAQHLVLFSVISSSWPFLTAWTTEVWINHLPVYKRVDSPIKLHCHGRFLLIKGFDAPEKETEVKKSVINATRSVTDVDELKTNP